MNFKKKIVIDADPGMGISWADIDDNFAILLALCAENVQLELVTVVSGNTEQKTGGKSLIKMLKTADIGLKCALGSPVPLFRKLTLGREVMRQMAGMEYANLAYQGVVQETDSTIDNKNGICELIKVIENSDEEITLVPLGPLTNIAILFMQRPDLIERIKEMVIMGGAVNIPGNVTPLAEFNFWVDPEAANYVFNLPIPKVLVGLNVTKKVQLDLRYVEQILNFNNKLNDFIYRSTKGWIEAIEVVSGNKYFNPHDPIAVSYLIHPEIFKTEQMDIGVDAKTAKVTGITSDKGNVRVCFDIDQEGFKDIFKNTFKNGSL